MGQLSKHFHRESTKYQLVSLYWDLKKKDDLIFPKVGCDGFGNAGVFMRELSPPTSLNFDEASWIFTSSRNAEGCRSQERGRLQKPGTWKVAEARNAEGSENKAVSSLRSTLGTSFNILRAAMNSDLSLLVSRWELVGNQPLGRRQLLGLNATNSFFAFFDTLFNLNQLDPKYFEWKNDRKTCCWLNFHSFLLMHTGWKSRGRAWKNFQKILGMQSKNDVVSYLFIFGGPYSLPYPSLLSVILLGDVGENAESLHYRFGDEGGGQFFKLSLFKYLKGRADMRKNIYFFNDAMFTKPVRNFFFFFFFSTFTWFRHIFYWNVNCLSKTNKFCVKWLKWLISCNFHRLFLKTNLFSSTFRKNEPNFTDFILFSLTFHQFLEIFSNFSQKWTKFQQLFSKMKQISPTFEHFCGKKSQFWSKWTNFVKNKPNVTAFLQIFIDFS